MLVTGATGMIGRAVVELLSGLDQVVLATSFDERSPWTNVEYVRADLRDFDQAKILCERVDTVVHVAGIKANVGLTKTRPASFMTPLLQMNSNIFGAAHDAGVRRVVFTSSIGVYPPGEVISEGDFSWNTDPMDLHPGWAKRIGEMQLSAIGQERDDFTFAIVRPSNVYGPGDNFNPSTAMVIGSLLGRARRGENPISVQGDGSAVRDFIFSRDVAAGIVDLAMNDVSGDFNLSAGSGVSIRQLADLVAETTGTELVFDKPFADAGYSQRVLSNRKALDAFGWSPATSLKEGLQTTWEWLQSNDMNQVGRLDYFSGSSD